MESNSNINIKRSNSTNHMNDFTNNESTNVPFKPKQRVTIPPPRSWGLQESIILGLVLLILLLSIFALSIFFNLFPIGSWANTSSKTSSLSSTANTISTNSKSTAQTTGNATSVSASSKTVSSASSNTTTSLSASTASTSSVKTSSASVSSTTSSNSNSSSTASSSKSSGSSSTSSVTVNGNTKIYLPKGDALVPVGRNFTGTDSTDKLIFALLERIKGPNAEEIAAGFKKDINFTGDSNCNGNWFEISSPSSTTLQINFCRPIQLSGTASDTLMEQGLTKSVTDNTEYTKVIILDTKGNCLFNASGDNKCLK